MALRLFSKKGGTPSGHREVRGMPSVLSASFVSSGTETTEGKTSVTLVFRDDPHGVDDAWDVAEDRQQDVDPKLPADSDLQEYS